MVVGECDGMGRMSATPPVTYLARHGETAWTLTGQHTGLTDIPVTERGERNARRLEERLKGLTFPRVFTSRFFLLSTASLSALGYEHDVTQPVVRLWDDTRHVEM